MLAISRVRPVAAVAAVGLLWVLIGLPFARASHEPGMPTYTGCLKKGKVSKLQAGDEPIKPCVVDKESKIHLSGGDITGITAGTGLSGGGLSADITLAILESFRLPQGCTSGQIASFNGTGWSCATDADSGGDITGVTAGTGLDGGGTSGDVSLDLETSFQLPQSCSTGDFVTWTGSAWGCATVGDITSVTAGTGLSGGATSGNATLDIATSYRLPQSCANTQIAKWNGSAWACGADDLGPGRVGFTRTAVDTTGSVGFDSSITIGRDGLPVISYFDDNTDDLKVFHCTDSACSAGTATPVDTAGSVGFDTSITIGQDGFPVVSYLDASNFDLKVFHCTDVACTGGVATPLDTAGNVGFDTSITIGQDGFPVVSYHDFSNADLKVFHCTDVACTGGAATPLDTAGSVGSDTSITIGRDGFPVVSYLDLSNLDLKVFHCTDVACTGGAATPLDTAGDVGFDTSITIGQDGLPVVSYRDASNFDLKVAHCSNVRCIPFHRQR